MTFKQVIKYGLLTGASFVIIETANGQNNDKSLCDNYNDSSVTTYNIGNFQESFNYAQKALKYSTNAQDSLKSYQNMVNASQNIFKSNDQFAQQVYEEAREEIERDKAIKQLDIKAYIKHITPKFAKNRMLNIACFVAALAMFLQGKKTRDELKKKNVEINILIKKLNNTKTK